MNTYNAQFYDLLSRGLGSTDARALQGFVDETLALKYNALQVDGFTFASDMQLDFTYEQLIKEVGLNVMANYYDLDSPAIPFATEGAESYQGKIPRQKAVEYWNEDKYRKMLIAEERFGANSDRVRNAALKGLFNTVDTLVGGHTNQLTYQRNQMVSKGAVTISADNNPYGIAGITLSAHVPAANVKTLTGTARWWTAVSDGVYKTPGTACDPIKDMQAIVKNARMKGIRGHFEVNDSFLDQILDHAKVAEAIKEKFSINVGTSINNVNLFSRSERIGALAAIVGADFKAIDSVVAVEKWDASQKKVVRNSFDAFESNVLVFVPDGNLGEILTVEPLKIAGGTYAEFYGGRLLITVGVDAVKKCQSFNSEMTSLVVPDKPQYMWYLHPYSA